MSRASFALGFLLIFSALARGATAGDGAPSQAELWDALLAAGDLDPVSRAERQQALALHAAAEDALLRAGGIKARPSGEPEVTVGISSARRHTPDRLTVDDGHVRAVFARSPVRLISLVEWSAAYMPVADEQALRARLSQILPEDVPRLAQVYLAAIERQDPEGEPVCTPDPYEVLGAGGERREVQPTDVFDAEWFRTYKGFRFLDDRTLVVVRAVDGSFQLYVRDHSSDLPTSVVVTITREQAIARAEAAAAAELRMQAKLVDREPKNVVREGTLLASRAAYERALEAKRAELRRWSAMFEPLVAVEPVVETEPKLLIVNPNEQFTDRYENEDWAKWTPRTRLAWVVRLLYEAPADAPQAWPHFHMEVWIDAENGKLLGGHLPY